MGTTIYCSFGAATHAWRQAHGTAGPRPIALPQASPHACTRLQPPSMHAGQYSALPHNNRPAGPLRFWQAEPPLSTATCCTHMRANLLQIDNTFAVMPCAQLTSTPSHPESKKEKEFCF